MTGKTKLNILLVDDDIDDRFLFKSALSRAAIEVVFNDAEDCNQALEKLKVMKDNLPDVIFMDLNMPDIDGFECIKTIKSNAIWASVPIIVYSTSGSQSHIDEAGRLGAIAYLKKPNVFEELCSKIENILNIDFVSQTKYLGLL